jgi:hypothetical protein
MKLVTKIASRVVRKRLRSAVVLSSLVVVGALMMTTTASAADWHLAKLDSVASSIAGHPVSVYCDSSQAEWVDVSRATSGAGDGLLGFTYGPNAVDPFGNSNTIYLNPTACTTFQTYAANGWGTTLAARDAGMYWLGGAALTLVHESIHQSGNADEGQTECAAIKQLPTDLSTLFGVPTTITVHGSRVANPTYNRLLGWANFWHKSTPPQYQAVC